MSPQVTILANRQVETFRADNNAVCATKNLLGRALPQMEQ